MTSAKASPIAAHPVVKSMMAMPNRAAANQAIDLNGLLDTDDVGCDIIDNYNTFLPLASIVNPDAGYRAK